MLDQVCCSSLTGLEGNPCNLTRSDGTVAAMTLVKTQEYPKAQRPSAPDGHRTPFTVTLRGPLESAFDSDTCKLQGCGGLDEAEGIMVQRIFSDDPAGAYYQIVFN